MGEAGAGGGSLRKHMRSPQSVFLGLRGCGPKESGPQAQGRPPPPPPRPHPGAWGDGGVLCGQSQARPPKTQGGLPTGDIKCYLKGRRI